MIRGNIMSMSKINKYWLGLSIGSKMRMFVFLVLFVILIAVGFNYYVIRFSVTDVDNILKEVVRCEKAQDAMRAEEEAFRTFVRAPSEENMLQLNQSVDYCRSTISLLPDNYQEIGAERFARTWRIHNAYRSYEGYRDLVCGKITEHGSSDIAASILEEDRETVELLYQVYDMQSYLNRYLQTISQLTVDHGSDVYNLKYPILQQIPFLLGAVSLFLLMLASGLAGLATSSIVTPIQKLAAAYRSISQGKLEEEDVAVSNKDELGELIDLFNRMKRATIENIHTLEENQILAEQLHKEAMERAQMEKRLEATRMDLLQSQIKPHFLFNTLNTISGMAELENAEKTDSMIRSLSRLFRYNLHTTDQFVSLSQELEVARDYLYLQKMRFGDRVQYELPQEQNGFWSDAAGNIMVPVFLLQPLIENAVIHGISKKEQGGRITVHAERSGDRLRIRVSDTGVGMDPGTLQGLKDRLKGEPSDVHLGIGLGNLYQRLTSLYGADSMMIRSAPGEGTQIDIFIPLRLESAEGTGVR